MAVAELARPHRRAPTRNVDFEVPPRSGDGEIPVRLRMVGELAATGRPILFVHEGGQLGVLAAQFATLAKMPYADGETAFKALEEFADIQKGLAELDRFPTANPRGREAAVTHGRAAPRLPVDLRSLWAYPAAALLIDTRSLMRSFRDVSRLHIPMVKLATWETAGKIGESFDARARDELASLAKEIEARTATRRVARTLATEGCAEPVLEQLGGAEFALSLAPTPEFRELADRGALGVSLGGYWWGVHPIAQPLRASATGRLESPVLRLRALRPAPGPLGAMVLDMESWLPIARAEFQVADFPA